MPVNISDLVLEDPRLGSNFKYDNALVGVPSLYMVSTEALLSRDTIVPKKKKTKVCTEQNYIEAD